jgi:hypothetical protein
MHTPLGAYTDYSVSGLGSTFPTLQNTVEFITKLQIRQWISDSWAGLRTTTALKALRFPHWSQEVQFRRAMSYVRRHVGFADTSIY